MTGPLLRIEDLATEFVTESGRLRVVDGISFDVAAGRTLGVVGESGCGKSVTALSIMGLLPMPANGRSNCSRKSVFRHPSGGSTSTPTSCRAVCGNAC
jgi:ABC-type dipeptide/oligopeptide/nickel transport system ATPase component